MRSFRSSRPSWSRRLRTLPAAVGDRLMPSVRISVSDWTCSVMGTPSVELRTATQIVAHGWLFPAGSTVRLASRNASARPGPRDPLGDLRQAARGVGEGALLPHQVDQRV